MKLVLIDECCGCNGRRCGRDNIEAGRDLGDELLEPQFPITLNVLGIGQPGCQPRWAYYAVGRIARH